MIATQCGSCTNEVMVEDGHEGPAVCEFCRDGGLSAKWAAEREKAKREEADRLQTLDSRLGGVLERMVAKAGSAGATSTPAPEERRPAIVFPTSPEAQQAAIARRIEFYIPKRFRRWQDGDGWHGRDCVLDLCPSPSAETGKCECPLEHHFVIYTPSQKQAHAAAVKWAERAGNGDGLALALLGQVGTGKSHLLYAAVRRANERGINCGAWGWFGLADTMRSASAEQNRDLRAKAAYDRDRVRGVAALGIDEIRPTSGTGYDGTQLSNLMTEAYRECQDVIVTSNYADAALAEIIGLAASSRLTQVVITGPDYRQRRAMLRAAPADAR